MADYSPHHNPFQYYASTANPHHLPPSSVRAIGHSDQANHEYDLSLIRPDAAGRQHAGRQLPEGRRSTRTGTPGYSDPLDEQNFIVDQINEIQQSPVLEVAPRSSSPTTTPTAGTTTSTPPVVNGSNDAANDTAMCSSVSIQLGNENDRCGYGVRQPLIVISPWTRSNYVSSNQTDTSSITKFIEDNWLHGQSTGPSSFTNIAGSLDAHGGVLDFHGGPNDNRLILDPTTGEVVRQ